MAEKPLRVKPHKRRLRPHNPMPESRYEVLALFTGAMVGASLLITSTGALMPFFRSALHLSQTQLGLVLSIQILGSVVMTSVAGLLTDRFGDKAVVLWSGLLMGVALIAAAAFQGFTWLIVWLAIYGLGFAAVTPAGSHAIIFFFKEADRGLAMGVRQCGVPLAGMLGSLLLPAIAARYDYRAALVTAGVITLLAGVIASRLYREPRELQGERISPREMFLEMVHIAREPRLILLTLTSMVLVCGQFVLLGFLTLTLTHEAAYAVPLAVALFTVSQAGGVVGRLSWGWMSDHWFGSSRTLPLAVVCLLVALIALGFASTSTATPLWFAALLAAAMGFASEGWFGLGVIGMAEIGGEEHSGSALGVGLTWTLAAAFVTPTLFGALVEVHGFSFAWRALALFELAGIVPALLASRRIAALSPN